MAINVSNTTQSLATALKDVQRLEAPDAKKKEKDTLTQISKARGEKYTFCHCIFIVINDTEGQRKKLSV